MMDVEGMLLIGGSRSQGQADIIWAVNPATGDRLSPGFGGATSDDLHLACELAGAAFSAYREKPLSERAIFLETIAQNILNLGDSLIDRCVAETGLPRARVEGERGRTVNQLRLFAKVVRDGNFVDARIDHALPDRKPLPRQDLRLRNIPLGPVAVFGASNFPLAFSVAGGDTASALAAGCPVIVKAHSAHPGTSELVGRAVQEAVRQCGLPEGVFSLLFGSGRTVGQGLVANPCIKAVGFTGSRLAGTTLMKIAADRSEPIPVYAEMSSLNPVVILPNALAVNGKKIGTDFIDAMTLGAGQFCTNPGLVFVIDGKGYEEFVASAIKAVEDSNAMTMLTEGIQASYIEGVSSFRSHPQVKLIAQGKPGASSQGQAALFETTADAFLHHPELHSEIFGAASLIVRCSDRTELESILTRIEGQLTIALHLVESDNAHAIELLPLLETKAGRIVINGFGTGVEVSHAMVHGGPFPSTSDSRTTSVGSLAISRFLRPVSYQNFPEWLRPAAIREDNPYKIHQLIDPNDIP